MTYSLYDKNILNFLYELTKLERFMGCDKISKKITLEKNKKISAKTVERWFSFLKEKYNVPGSKTKEKFNFYPTFFFEKLGLTPIYVISEKPNLKILDMLPFQDYVVWLFDPKINESVLLTGYLVPIRYLERFKEKWKKIKQKGFVRNYKIYITQKGFSIYSPWHKIIDKQGVFHPENNAKEEIDKQFKEFKSYINNLPKIEMIALVKRNPLIIPVLFEYYYQYWTSPKVWKAIKRKLGNKIWNYIIKKKEQTDAIGIKRIQQTLKEVYDLIHQMCVVYMPLELENNFYIYFIVSFKEKEKINKIKDLALNSIYLKMLPITKNKIFLISLTNSKGLKKILKILENLDVTNLYFLQHEKSLPLLTTQRYKKHDYYNHFNPKAKKWVWN